MARTVAIHTGSSDSDLQRPLSQLLGLVFDLVQRHRPPWPRKPAVVHLLLVAHSTHALQAHSFSDGYVVLPAVVGERRYELVQLSPPWRRYTPSRDIGVPAIGDCAIDVHHHRGLPQACHGRVDARHARQVAAHSWIAERGRAREQREPSQPTKRATRMVSQKHPASAAFETGALLQAKKRPESRQVGDQVFDFPPTGRRSFLRETSVAALSGRASVQKRSPRSGTAMPSGFPSLFYPLA